MTRTLLSIGLSGVLAVAMPAQAQDLDDLIGNPGGTPSVGDERRELMDEDAPSTQKESKKEEKRVIKTNQRKTFVKVGRYEGGIAGGFVTNDPFLNRYLVAGNFAYHVTEIFAVEGNFSFSPSLGEADYKPITDQIINENQVTPDISRIQFYPNITFQFSPIYGKAAVFNKGIINFDLYGLFGTGVVNTADDLEALDAVGEEVAEATRSQFHPTLNYGGGIRVIFTESFALRAEARGLSYIEVLESTTLEMKNNMTFMVAASFFFPGME